MSGKLEMVPHTLFIPTARNLDAESGEIGPRAKLRADTALHLMTEYPTSVREIIIAGGWSNRNGETWREESLQEPAAMARYFNESADNLPPIHTIFNATTFYGGVGRAALTGIIKPENFDRDNPLGTVVPERPFERLARIFRVVGIEKSALVNIVVPEKMGRKQIAQEYAAYVLTARQLRKVSTAEQLITLDGEDIPGPDSIKRLEP